MSQWKFDTFTTFCEKNFVLSNIGGEIGGEIGVGGEMVMSGIEAILRRRIGCGCNVVSSLVVCST